MLSFARSLPVPGARRSRQVNETLTASAVGFVVVGVVHCLYPERDCAARLTVLWCVCCLLYTLARDVAARVISAVVCLSSVCLSVCVRL